MSGGSDKLALKEDDVSKMLAATTHIGSTNTDFQMEQYIFKRRSDGMFCTPSVVRTILIKLLFAQEYTSSTSAAPTRSFC